MKLILHDCLATAPLVVPFQSGWIEHTDSIEVRASVSGSDAGPGEAALLPSAEIALLQETHAVVPGIAVVFDGAGMVSMRVPVRPDEIERTIVRLYETSGAAELLARATMESFYGIAPVSWTRDESPEAQVVVVEGAGALVPPESGFSEDLVRAWFILTGQPLVSHLLVVPKQGDSIAVQAVMAQARSIGHERRKDLRKIVAERFGVDREKLVELAEHTRFAIGEPDRRALLMLLQRGNKGSAYPYVWKIDYAGEPASAE